MSRENNDKDVFLINAMIDKASVATEKKENSFAPFKESIVKDTQLRKAILSFQISSKLTDEYMGQLIVNLARISGSTTNFKDNLEAIKTYLKPEHQDLSIKLDPSLPEGRFISKCLGNVETIAKFCRTNRDIFKNIAGPSISAPQTPYSKTNINSKRQIG